MEGERAREREGSFVGVSRLAPPSHTPRPIISRVGAVDNGENEGLGYVLPMLWALEWRDMFASVW